MASATPASLVVVDRSCAPAGGPGETGAWLAKALADIAWTAADVVCPSSGASAPPVLAQAAIVFVHAAVSPVGVRGLRERCPALTLAVISEDHTCASWPAFARAGADEIWLAGSVLVAAGVAPWVQERLDVSAPSRTLAHLVPQLPHGLPGAVASYCVRNALRRLHTTAVAEHFGLSERTLRRRLREAGLPAPERLWSVGRPLHVVEAVRSTGDGAGALTHPGAVHWDAHAPLVGYEDPRALRRACARLRAACRRDAALADFVRLVPALAWALPDDA